MLGRFFVQLRQATKSTTLSRPYSTSAPPPPPNSSSSSSPFRLFFSAAFLSGASLALLAKYSDSSSYFHRTVTPFLFQSLPPETAHRLAILSASLSLHPTDGTPEKESLSVDLWGMRFTNCVGIAAGFDKHAEAMSGLFKMGFGFVEIGSVTPLPQPGNPTPRFFRLPLDKAVINRYGFNSQGAKAAGWRLEQWRQGREVGGEKWGKEERQILGVNLGKNKESVSAAGDYVTGLRELGKYGDYVVVNVSSPNTAGLRDLQHKDQLRGLIKKIVEARAELFPNSPKHLPPCSFNNRKAKGYAPPLLLKIAPDGLTLENKRDIVDIINEFGIEGLIVCNTTVSRPESLKSLKDFAYTEMAMEKGGLSGAPLRDMSTKLVGEMYQLTEGKVPIIGVGGISTAQDAYDKICHGASLVQVYTAFGYEGPSLIPDIKNGLEELLKENGFQNVQEAVGSAFKN